MEDEGNPLFDRKLAQRGLQVEITICLRRRLGRDLARRCQPASEQASPATLEPKRLANDDPMEPRRKPVRLAKCLPMPPGALEGDLNRVLGISSLRADQDGDPQQSPVVLGDEEIERGCGRRLASS